MQYPSIAVQWHPTKNASLSPSMFSMGSSAVVWWKCEMGHEWESSISERTSTGNGCPFCSGHRVLQGFNDLASKRPDIANDWNYRQNGELRPCDVYVNSTKRVWWCCERGHEWEAIIRERTRRNARCPFCSGKRVMKGFNDLATRHPNLLDEWHPSKNLDFFPHEVTSGSKKKAWWKCNKCGHEWQTQINNRSRGSGCPICAETLRHQKKSQ